MTNCPRCGLQVRPDTPVCPRCGTALLSGAQYPPNAPDASVPAWVRQFQGQQPAPQPGYGQPQPGFAVGSLVSEEALPTWLRPGAAPAGSAPAWGQPNPAWGGAAAPNGGYQPAPGFGMPAQPSGMGQRGGGQPPNPFDEAALPEWLRQGANAADPRMRQMGPQTGYQQPAPAGYPGGAYAGYPGAPNQMPAGALMDNRALPAWMNQPPGGAYGGGQQPGREGMSAGSLIDESALPQWLRGDPQAVAQAAQWGSPTGMHEPLPAWLAQIPGAPPPPAANARPPAGSLNGGQLADESALPDWLRAQAAQGGARGPAGNGAARPGANPLNPGALPPWLQTGAAGGADARFSASQAGQPQARRPVNSEWLTDAHVPAPNAGGAPLQGSEVPEWLRNQPPGQSRVEGSAAGSRRGGAPPDPLRTEEMPSWLRGGEPGPDGRAGSSAQRRGPRGGGRPDESAQWGASRVRSPRADPRRQAGYGGYDESDEYEEPGYEEWDEGPPDDRGGRQKRGIFGRLRRK